MTAEFCQLVGMVSAYLDKHPADGADRLRAFLRDDEARLLDTTDVMELTGWSHSHVVKLCKQNILPHIPGSPHKFLKAPLRRPFTRCRQAAYTAGKKPGKGEHRNEQMSMPGGKVSCGDRDEQ